MRVPNRVYVDNRDLGYLGVQELAHQGCRTVGFIAPIPTGRHLAPDYMDAADAYLGFVEAVREFGLRTSSQWIVTLDNQPLSHYPSSERWGYEAFQRIWKHPTHPDGVLVANDADGLGVTMAILEKGLRVPDDLRAVYHKNAEFDLFCPFPVTSIVCSADEMAKGLIEVIERQFQGEDRVTVTVKLKVDRVGSATMRRVGQGAK